MDVALRTSFGSRISLVNVTAYGANVLAFTVGDFRLGFFCCCVIRADLLKVLRSVLADRTYVVRRKIFALVYVIFVVAYASVAVVIWKRFKKNSVDKS